MQRESCHSDETGQHALNNAAVEVVEGLGRHTRLPDPPQEVQPWLTPFL